MKLTAQELRKLGIVDEVIPEPQKAELITTNETTARAVSEGSILRHLREVQEHADRRSPRTALR